MKHPPALKNVTLHPTLATHKSSMLMKAGFGGFLAGRGCLAYFVFTAKNKQNTQNKKQHKLCKKPIIHPFLLIYFGLHP